MLEGPLFFLPDLQLKSGISVPLPKEANHHAMRVLRMRDGDSASVFTGSGTYADGKMHFSQEGSFFEVKNIFFDPEPQLKITLLQSLIAHEKMDWVIEKACEIGITHIVIFPAQRGEIRLNEEKITKRLERWAKILIASCMQCKRTRLPTLQYTTSYKEALALARGLKFVTAPSLQKPHLSAVTPTEVSFVIGPEGGLTEGEISEALVTGFQPLLLGPRVFRTETAGLVAAAWAQTIWGDFA